MRVPSGVSGLDELTQGGFLPCRLYALSGPPGSGKTTFTAQFVAEGLRNGEKCMYITMHKTEDELASDMLSSDSGFETFASSEGFCFINLVSPRGKHILNQFPQTGRSSSVQSPVDKIVVFVNSRQVDRLVIDSTILLRLPSTSGSEEMTWFLMALKQGDATTLLVSGMMDLSPYSDEHFLTHGMVSFHNYLEATGIARGIQAIKVRGTNIDCDTRSLEFTDNGLVADPRLKVDL